MGAGTRLGGIPVRPPQVLAKSRSRCMITPPVDRLICNAAVRRAVAFTAAR
jgi:hypothetical protein